MKRKRKFSKRRMIKLKKRNLLNIFRIIRPEKNRKNDNLIKNFQNIMSIIELRVCGRYKLGPKIGVGSFGSIYLAKNVQSNNDVAIKIEEVKSKHP